MIKIRTPRERQKTLRGVSLFHGNVRNYTRGFTPGGIFMYIYIYLFGETKRKILENHPTERNW